MSEHIQPKIFVTSDLHIRHKNILKFNPDTRPWATVEEMEDAIATNWNSVVGENDIVWNLGDVFFGHEKYVEPFLSRLNGHHHLILGNHDQRFAKFNKGILQLTGLGKKMLDKGYFRSIQTYSEFYHDKKFVCLFHYSPRVWNKAHHNAYMLYGHSHGGLKGIGRSMDVGIDSSEMASNATPFLLDDVLAYLEKREPVQHH